ncbi:MAG: lipopolysaccharide heptosyltransferase II [Endomicrobiia bacterium]
MKILIIKPSGIGDIVHSLPVAIALKKIYPCCKIDWIVFDKFESILYNLNYIDNIISWNREGGIKEYFQLLKKLKKENYDLIIDLQVLLRTAILGFLIKYKKVFSTSFVREFSNFFVYPVAEFDYELHAVERNYQVAKFFAEKEKVLLEEPMNLLPWINITEEEKIFAKKILDYNEEKKYIIFSVGSRGWHKIWPKENFLELIFLLTKNFKNVVAVFVGSKQEKIVVEQITKNLSFEYKDFTGETSLRELCAIINLSTMTISNDNGIAHVSAALDKPTLVLFGPSNPKWFYPYNNKSGYIYKNYKCSPCGIKTNCRDNKCMKEIKVEEVFEYILGKFAKYL